MPRSNRSLLHFILLGTALAATLTAAFAYASPSQKDAVPKAAPATAPSDSSEGEHIFQQRCSNCHNAPEGFSQRISGTIVRHMRVRASLSKREEEELLRFLNP